MREALVSHLIVLLLPLRHHLQHVYLVSSIRSLCQYALIKPPLELTLVHFRDVEEVSIVFGVWFASLGQLHHALHQRRNKLFIMLFNQLNIWFFDPCIHCL